MSRKQKRAFWTRPCMAFLTIIYFLNNILNVFERRFQLFLKKKLPNFINLFEQEAF